MVVVGFELSRQPVDEGIDRRTLCRSHLLQQYVSLLVVLQLNGAFGQAIDRFVVIGINGGLFEIPVCRGFRFVLDLLVDVSQSVISVGMVRLQLDGAPVGFVLDIEFPLGRPGPELRQPDLSIGAAAVVVHVRVVRRQLLGFVQDLSRVFLLVFEDVDTGELYDGFRRGTVDLQRFLYSALGLVIPFQPVQRATQPEPAR